MTRKSVILHFGPDLTDKPIISGMLRKFDISVNILQASITPDEAGTMFVWLEGDPAEIRNTLGYLEEVGVRLVFPKKNLIWDEKMCTHCGACVGQCLPKALSISNDSGCVSLDHERCLACELCIPACPFGALQSVAEHLG